MRQVVCQIPRETGVIYHAEPIAPPDESVLRLERLFWRVCIPTRLTIIILVAWALRMQGRPRVFVRPLVATCLFLPATGFWYNAIIRRPTHGGLGGEVWWSEARWVHASLWTMAGVCVILDREWYECTFVLGVDVAVGMGIGYSHYTSRLYGL